VTPGDEKLAAALQGEYAAIYAYGVIGPRLGGAVGLAQAAEQVHRSRRDALIARLSAKGINVPAAEAAYALPFPVTDPASGYKLAIQVEDRSAAIWRLALADTSGDERKLALGALVDCATRSTVFRRQSNTAPLTTAFPGKP
jgi:hypothetical protein